MMQQLARLLPGYNCGICGYRQCKDFAAALIEGKSEIDNCPYLKSERSAASIPRIREILDDRQASTNSQDLIGVIDGLRADFIIAPLPGEASCREDLHPFDTTVQVAPGDLVRYRPWGCPITHFAKVLDVKGGILTVHLVGPIHRLREDGVTSKDIGICMVAGFDGIVKKGRIPDVGQTVKFLPEHCMMQKVHSGVIVHSEGTRVRIEGVDLKVW